MFATSDKFKEVIRDTSEQYLMGIITTNDGATHEVNDSVISSGSVAISKQSMTKQEFSYGGAILGELDISIRTDESRYLFYGAELDLWCGVVIGEEMEYVPMGIWTIAEAERDKKALKIVAYDNLIKFDKRYDLTLEGTPFELMSAFARECGCELAEDKEYYNLLTNGTEHITINKESGCSTYREAAGLIAQMCGCFVQADRYGLISMKQFSTAPAFSLNKGQRYSSKISDFICHYIELEVTGRAGTFVSVSEGFDDGMKMVMDNAPAWDFGLEEELQARADNLRAYLEQLSYTPSEVSIPSDPSIDCGDMVTLYTDDGEVNSLITSYEWQYRGATTLTSDGINPYLQTSNAATSRQLQNLKQEIDAAKVIYYPFKNASRVQLGRELQKVASVVFTTVADTSVVFQGTFQVDVSVADIESTQTISITVPTITQDREIVIDAITGEKVYTYKIGEKVMQYPIKTYKRGFANLYIHYFYDNIDQKIEYIGSLNDGGHVISLYYPVNKVDINTTHTFEIWMSIENGDAAVPEGMFIGAVSGQGLAAISQWNGQLEIQEYIERLHLQNIREIRPFTDEVSIANNTRNKSEGFSDRIARFARTPISIREITDHFGEGNIRDSVNIIVRQQTVKFNFGSNKYVEQDEGWTYLKTTYITENRPAGIDMGVMHVLPVENTGFAEIGDLEVFWGE